LEKQTPPYWNSTSGLDFDHITVLGMASDSQIIHPHRSYDVIYRFSRWLPLWRNFTSGFRFGDVAVFRRSASISKANFTVI